MEEQKKQEEGEYGGIETLPMKEKVQFFIAFSLVVLTMIGFGIKIYFL